jgi:hypothetical protein
MFPEGYYKQRRTALTVGLRLSIIIIIIIIRGKANPVTGRGGRQGYETSRLPHCIDNRLADGDEVVSPTRRQDTLYPQVDSGYSFLFETELTPGP